MEIFRYLEGNFCYFAQCLPFGLMRKDASRVVDESLNVLTYKRADCWFEFSPEVMEDPLHDVHVEDLPKNQSFCEIFTQSSKTHQD